MDKLNREDKVGLKSRPAESSGGRKSRRPKFPATDFWIDQVMMSSRTSVHVLY